MGRYDERRNRRRINKLSVLLPDKEKQTNLVVRKFKFENSVLRSGFHVTGFYHGQRIRLSNYTYFPRLHSCDDSKTIASRCGLEFPKSYTREEFEKYAFIGRDDKNIRIAWCNSETKLCALQTFKQPWFLNLFLKKPQTEIWRYDRVRQELNPVERELAISDFVSPPSTLSRRQWVHRNIWPHKISGKTFFLILVLCTLWSLLVRLIFDLIWPVT